MSLPLQHSYHKSQGVVAFQREFRHCNQCPSPCRGPCRQCQPRGARVASATSRGGVLRPTLAHEPCAWPSCLQYWPNEHAPQRASPSRPRPCRPDQAWPAAILGLDQSHQDAVSAPGRHWVLPRRQDRLDPVPTRAHRRRPAAAGSVPGTVWPCDPQSGRSCATVSA